MRKRVFYLQFAGLVCAVDADDGWRKYFRKYFDQTPVRVRATLPTRGIPQAHLRFLKAHTANPSESVLSVRTKPLDISVGISGDVHVGYPMVNTVVQKIFTHAFYYTNGLVIHASAVAQEGFAHLFVGRSGSGKTTIVRLLADRGLRVIADNHVFLRQSGEEQSVYPFPFDQFHTVGREMSPLHLGCVFILQKGNRNHVQPLSFAQRLDTLRRFVQVQVPEGGDANRTARALFRKHLLNFISYANLALLRFTKSEDIWETIAAYVEQTKKMEKKT